LFCFIFDILIQTTMRKFTSVIAFLIAFQFFCQTPTWSGDVARIFYANCTKCHRNGGIGPFSLMDYQTASTYAPLIPPKISSRKMPPWNADPTYKNYAHERVLSASDIAKIQQWVANGTPSGDLRFAPPAPTYSNGSQLGTVDLTLKMNNYTVASNNDEYRNFVIPSGLIQSKFATAIEIIPGNSAIVHHALIFSDSTNTTINTTGTGGTGSAASKLIYEYVPGAQPYFTPVGTGIRLPANTRIIFQIHYAHGSQGQLDSTRINFKLSTAALRNINVNALLNHGSSLTNGPLNIPANQTNTFHEAFPLPPFVNWTFLTASPHMHLIGRTFLTYAVKNTAPFDTIRFVRINDWNFHWQDNYIFQHALKVPTGYTLRASAFYDNTSNNPYNPSTPPQNVSAGEATTDEMMMVFFSYLPYQTGDENLIIDKRISPMGATTFCNGQWVELRTIQGPNYTYQWHLNGSPITGATSYYHNANQPGNYTVFITCGPNSVMSDPVAITVNPLPVAAVTPTGTISIQQGNSATLTGNTGTGYSYQWYLDGSAISGATSSTYNATLPGTYELEVYNGCYAVSNQVVVTVAAGISENTSGAMINVYPNPTDGLLIIDTEIKKTLRIFNAIGQLKYEGVVSGKGNFFQLEETGVHTLEFSDEKGVITTKRILIAR
jgi:hypothetical protein